MNWISRRLPRYLAVAGLTSLLGMRLQAGFAGADVFIPAVARADGQAGARFYSTLWVTNLSDTTADVTLELLLQGRPNPTPEARREAIAPGATRRIDDVVGGYFGYSSAGAAIRIRSDRPVFASSRTYSQPIGTDLKDAVGLFFTAIPSSFAIALGETSSLQGISNGPPESYRYNFGLVETTGQAATVAVTARDEYGTPIGSPVQYSLGGFEARQVNAFAGFPVPVSTRNGRLDITVTNGLGRVISYGTLVAGTPENPGSNDSIGFEMGFRNLLAGGVQSVNGLTGAVNIRGSATATVTTSADGNITISGVQGSGTVPPVGSTNYMLRGDGRSWVESGALLNDGQDVTLVGRLLKAGSLFLHGYNDNLFVGADAGNLLSTGTGNTGAGAMALRSNTTGALNSAVGFRSLFSNISGVSNTAVGFQSLYYNTAGNFNAALGTASLQGNVSGAGNTAAGSFSLASNTSGGYNTAVGNQSLVDSSTGAYNIALGFDSGGRITTGSYNIHIGHPGYPSDNRVIRLGNENSERTYIAGVRGTSQGLSNAVPVLIDNYGQLGIAPSSSRFKDDIRDMGDTTAELARLRPVTFRYKGRPDILEERHYGLIAEEVDAVFPELVARSADGDIETVKYQELPAMLLNELQRMAARHAEAEDRLQAEIQRQAGEIEALKRLISGLVNERTVPQRQRPRQDGAGMFPDQEIR